MQRPTDHPQLWGFIKSHFNIRLPHRSFTPGHSSPFAFVADAILHPSRDLAAWANRSGGKTLCASIIAALTYRFAGDMKIQGRVLSGSEDQARFAYKYWGEFARTVLPDLMQGEPGQRMTRLKNGDFEILAASQKRVRGGKVQLLLRDEVDEIDPELWAASVGMLDSRGGVAARTIDTSTWHHPQGPMGQLVESAEAKGITVHKWAVWESIANCPTERHQRGKGCQACPLGEVCLAKARAIVPTTKVGAASMKPHGLTAIDDVIKQYKMWSQAQWEAEAECKRPTLTGMVYPQFDRRVHVKSDLDFDDDLPILRTIDWGYRDFICLWVQVDKKGCTRLVDEYWAQDATLDVHAKAIQAKDKNVTVEATYCDPAGLSKNDQTGYSDIQVFRKHGIRCQYTHSPWARDVHNGINLIRAALKPAGGPPRMIIAGGCRETIKAFESYKLRQVNGEYIDEPVKPQPCDHPMDALRYLFTNRHAPMRSEAKTLGYSG